MKNNFWNLLRLTACVVALVSCSSEKTDNLERSQTQTDFSQADTAAPGVDVTFSDADVMHQASAKGKTDSDVDGTASEKDIDDAIDNLLGDHETYRRVFDDFQSAVAAKDKASVASLVYYPIGVSVDGSNKVVGSKQEFVENYDRFMTPEIIDTVKHTAYRMVMVNAQGVMLGSGEVWISGICKDDACADVDVKVVTLQSAPDE